MPSDNQIKKQFRAIGHKLHPLVTVSKGFTANVKAEVDRALHDHELIKIKVVVADRDEKKALIAEICRTTKSELIQSAGHIALIYRPNPKANKNLSNLSRNTVDAV